MVGFNPEQKEEPINLYESKGCHLPRCAVDGGTTGRAGDLAPRPHGIIRHGLRLPCMENLDLYLGNARRDLLAVNQSSRRNSSLLRVVGGIICLSEFLKCSERKDMRR